ncbi:trehalose-phosphatase [Brevibacterium sp. UCMA 11752]|uniref:trehalose-phosphatase n=1 Tax=Brevibacterium sp. UCMA 11752 TaxID=2745946 RepID=UPI001F1A4FB8|nr:trehalose-phosphatase [Brevibacterium sp. UCMA 11752]MCF2586567.1 trehalose-phosphatase [Brevibacterium sp. UCMA 11752]
MSTVEHDYENLSPLTPIAASVSSSGLLGDLAEASRELSPELFRRLFEVSRSPSLLIATDYDGTIAPIVDLPGQAFPLDSSVDSLRALALLPSTSAGVISGRSLRDLAAMSRLPREVHLFGSHGGETDTVAIDTLDPEQRTALDGLRRDLFQTLPTTIIEHKTTGAAVHLRGLDEAERHKVESAVDELVDTHTIFPTRGKQVIDLSVVPSSKAEALTRLREQTGAEVVVFIGDDTADEFALETLGEADLGLKVGRDPAETHADFPITSPEEVSVVLAAIYELRKSWLFGRRATPIHRHSLLGNGQSTALVDPFGSICWMPHPLPHSSSMFSEILGAEAAGFFAVDTEAGTAPLTQRYLTHSTLLETRWPGLNCIDYLAPVDANSDDTIVVRVLTGDTAARIRFAPRLDYATVPTRMIRSHDGVQLLGTSEPISLIAPGLDFEISETGQSHTAEAVVVPSDMPGGVVVLVLACGTGTGDARYMATGGEHHVRERALNFWTNWVDTLNIPSHHREEVIRSAVTLRALCHEPTGGVLAAPTTSLPEGIGGVRNWDYRYTWLRDGSMTVRALLSLGSTGEAEGFLSWLTGILTRTVSPEQLHPLYAVDGSALTTEAVLAHLPGYAGSRPVRVGNAAEHQVQLDVFGPVTELLNELSEHLGDLPDSYWTLTCQMVEAVSKRWFEADHGIWEARRPPKHNVYTRVMCWVTVDRALQIAERFGRELPGAWRQLREEIAHDVLENGYNEEVGAFTVAYGETDLDSACLFVGLSGLLPADDPRFVSTVDAIERDLRVGPTVFRYRYDDGLPGLEGGFHICTTWLIEAFIKVGRIDDAWDLFRQLDNLLGPTGLLAEEYDPVAEMHLGNHPQAYSHLGYIRVAQMLDAYRPS